MVSLRRRTMVQHGSSPTPPTPTWYVTDGLVLHWDGINNTGDGHDDESTVWKDLTGNGYDLTLSDTNAEIGSNYVQPKRRMSSAIGLARTEYEHFEIVFDAWYGGGSCLIHAMGNNTGTLWLGGTNQIVYTKAGSGGYYGIAVNAGVDSDHGIINAVSMAVDTTPQPCYLNGVSKGTADLTRSTSTWGTSPGSSYWFAYNSATAYVFQHKIYSIRLYNRVLTDSEILQNWLIDKDRFGL